jgi:CDP-glucose 4,6-dehydratase
MTLEDKIFEIVTNEYPATSEEASVLIRIPARDLLTPVDIYSVNVMGTVNLLEAVRHVPEIQTVVNAATDKCYERNHKEYWAYNENDHIGGIDLYSSSQACSELVTEVFRKTFFNPAYYKAKHNVALASVRFADVIGGGDFSNNPVASGLRAILFTHS